jgi:hypothetical protein
MKHARPVSRRRAALIGGFAVVLAGATGITVNAFAGTTSLHDDFEDGDTAGWAKSGGTWAVVTDGGKVLRQSDTGNDLAREFAGDTGWTDYTLSARVKATSLTAADSAAGIAARASGAHQFDRLVLAPGVARLEQVKGSAITVLGSAAVTATGWHTLRIDVNGSAITGYVDGAKVASGKTSIAKGRVGVQTVDASAEFDDVTVGDPAAVPTVSATASVSPTATISVSPSATASRTATASPSATRTTSPTASTTTSTGGSTGTSPTAAWPTATSTTTLHATREISGSFDGGNAQFVAGSELGDGDQGEDQKPLFELADGSTLSNVIIGVPAADGVHCLGTCTLRNVWWLDVGEDAATQKGKITNQVMTIDGGGAKHADDKVFQHNGPGTFVIKNFQAEDIGKLYRSCGNCSTQFARKVQVSNVVVTAPMKDLVGINPNLGDTATINNVTVIGSSSKTVICAEFKGVTSGEPTQVSSVPNASCVATGITLK